eukprot:CAMPEP_0205909734 /NCGR_PEP_ID=MMETSP1325-20131115/4062_1 /ASSEMBLY_ACC=CAM_ASM_000708 /TAXON_ID=236786 /ORGANISM="Florenciella sp., Strain RCC1007" /LENGTH=250 /DNA_ID=CAMNT_0053276055 /DNA_START=9 /DNA_END=758 /DNA_ORIENTATION=-
MAAQTDAAKSKDKVIFLFDVDGTLTPARKEVSPEMLAFLADLRTKVTIGFVGGSDLKKQEEQLGKDVLSMFDYCFSENGLMAFKDGVKIGQQSIATHLGEDNLQRLINWVLAYLSNITLPCKRGTFIEFRAGMLNVSPVGRNCSQEERDAFEIYDGEHNIRSTMVTAMKAEFADLNLTFSIGGQISFDVFPQGWDKTFALQFVSEFEEIHFFGDKTHEGGNDYEIYEDSRTIGHAVTCPDDTMKICAEIW